MGQKDPLQFPCTEKGYNFFKKGLRLMFGGGSIVWWARPRRVRPEAGAHCW